ncbi:MAG: hypothetical protein Q8T09_11175 [Candidatus Melainabacteria bacterium]|jgi:hypothetical protein|nr:hypothetical protein [Candidatus Melainabacteria bacterium]
METNQKNFLFKAATIVGSLLVLRVGWIALNMLGAYIAIFAVFSFFVILAALLVAPIPTAERLKQVVASVKSIFS